MAVQITCFIKSSADQEKTATSGRMERVRRSNSRPYLGNYSIRSTEADFIANFPEIHPIFPANSRSKSKLLTFRKLIRECSKLSFARGLFVSATAPELRHISRLAEPHFAVERISLIGLPSMKMVFARSSSTARHLHHHQLSSETETESAP